MSYQENTFENAQLSTVILAEFRAWCRFLDKPFFGDPRRIIDPLWRLMFRGPSQHFKIMFHERII